MGNRAIDSVQRLRNFINIPSPHTFSSYFTYDPLGEGRRTYENLGIDGKTSITSDPVLLKRRII